jgi:hypothetical protein
MFEGEWGGERGMAKGFEKPVKGVRPMMLYFVGMLRRDAGTLGARDISRRLWIDSASLERRGDVRLAC